MQHRFNSKKGPFHQKVDMYGIAWPYMGGLGIGELSIRAHIAPSQLSLDFSGSQSSVYRKKVGLVSVSQPFSQKR